MIKVDKKTESAIKDSDFFQVTLILHNNNP